MTAEDFYISLDSVKIWLMNYPYNCFTLDLSNNTMVKKKGIKQIFLHFPILDNYSAEIYLQGKSLACNREIKSHKFFFSGPVIKLLDLGKIYMTLEKKKSPTQLLNKKSILDPYNSAQCSSVISYIEYFKVLQLEEDMQLRLWRISMMRMMPARSAANTLTLTSSATRSAMTIS